MPEENLKPALLLAIKQLEEHGGAISKIKSQNYNNIQKYFQNDSGVEFDRTLCDRILKVCIRDLEEDLKWTADIVHTISVILKRIQSEEHKELQYLLPSALGILNTLNTISLLNNMTTLRILCVSTFVMFPNDILESIATDHREALLELFHDKNVQCPNGQSQIKYRIMMCQILHKVITILPSDKKTEFVKSGMNLWFSKVIPAIVSSASCSSDDTHLLDLLETLTDVLLTLNYMENPRWINILECICNPNKYPQIMKSLLENGSTQWHRLWIVFIRLLNNQITRNTNNVGTPINSMLPVVETAFKMDAANRCKAFHCWSVLINIFSKETNEHCIMKRLKLLIIPLKLNNAKVEETAIAKFEAWWLLITKFRTKLDKVFDSMLIGFLHFCFGKHNSIVKTTFIPGQLSMTLKKKGVQAFVEIVGHIDCEGCTDVAKLKDRLINTKYLIDFWNDWAHSLKTVMKIAIYNNNRQHILCIWKSFLCVIAQLPDSNVKKGVFIELLTIMATTLQDCRCEDICNDIVFKALVPSLFIKDLRLENILKSIEGQQKGALYKVILIIVDPSLKSVYQRLTTQDIIAKLKPITDFILDEISKWPAKNSLDQILHDLPSNDTTLVLWTAIAESICNCEYELCIRELSYLLQWPLKSSNMFTDVQYAAKIWYKLYDSNYVTLEKINIAKHISELLLSSNIVMHSSIYFTMCAVTAILKNGLPKSNGNAYEKEAGLLKTLLKRIDGYENIKEVCPMIIDTLVVMLNHATNNINDNFAETTLISVKLILKLVSPVLTNQSDIRNMVTLIRLLLKSTESFFEVESYAKFHSIIFDQLNQNCNNFDNQLLLKDVIQSLLKKKPIITNDNNQTVCDSIDLTSDNVEENDADCKFTAPNIKEVPKKGKKKEASIVNTVIENGEEFVVVKSNWKFNPRKLTENQKEKLQRKREDIPALYQDLSQSQDEFKMAVWKTDSQDNSTTSKSSSRSVNEGVDTSNLLKNTNSANLVPKIMENILSEKNKKEADKQSEQCSDITAKNNSTELQPITPKHKKTPRMALKDRVFRNVRNLIEKSASSGNTKDQNSSCNQIDVTKTPISKPKDVGNLVNSAPSLLLCDRPSRVKRKPRKFDDSEIFAIKKRRQSQSDSQTCNEELDNVPHTSIEEPVITNDDQGRIEKETILIDTSLKQQENLDDAKVVEDITALGDYKSSILDMVNNLETSICVENITADNKTTTNFESPNTDRHQNDNIDNDKEKIDPDKESVTKDTTNASDTVSTPKYIKIAENSEQTPSAKKSSVKKSRIEKELAIDMVEGHPFLNTPTTTEMRITRKNTASPVNSLRRKKVSEKINKTKTDTKITTADKKEKRKLGIKNTNVNDIDTTDDRSSSPEGVSVCEESCSEDIIESSQDSTLTTITVIKKTPKRLPVVTIEKMQIPESIEESNNATQNLINDTQLDDFSEKIETTLNNSKVNEKPCEILQNEKNKEKIEQGTDEKESVFNNVKETPEICEEIRSENLQSKINICSIVESDSYLHESKDDTELPQNKLLAEDKNESELTENMDTAPILEQDMSNDVIVINDDEQPVMSVSSDENIVGPQTQELAEADTQSNQTTDIDVEINAENTQQPSLQQPDDDNIVKETYSNQNNNDISDLVLKNDLSSNIEKTSDVSSPLKDDAQRKQDFLDNTIEISPIKTMSPDLEKKSPSPDRSGDYVVIKLSSPVHSNGEPFDKGSPEFFSEEKISPDKRDQSPPRNEVAIINTSPSSSLSLKKNRPQVRSGGRAAQMLGLCVPDKLNPLINSERIEVDDNRKNSPSNTPARRNLRILYNSVGDNSENAGENEENENFLKLKRSLPTVNSSPSGPILKRKLAEITDDTTISPANKRKRVSFHDPPVSTTISVQKYIEPCGVRSPQNSAHKKQERQARMLANLKSPKRLDNLFSLDSVLTKTVESFTDVDISLTNTDDSQMTSLEATPAVEIVKTSELNDTDPICPQLVDCKDSIDNIAVELSSPAMKMLLIKELERKVVTIGDLAKMTELEVNRLCIKAPKVKVAKKVLMEYASNIESNITDKDVDKEAPDVEIAVPVQDSQSVDSAVQTNELVTADADMQTSDVPVSLVSTQTEKATTSSVGAQTDESGTKTTAEIIQQCISEKPDFVMQLSEQLHECSIQQIAKKLSFGAAIDTLMAKVNDTNSKMVLDRLLDNQCIQESKEQNYTNQLAFLSDYLRDKFETKDLILFCSELLKKVYNNSA
ncbi:telomere-associated protein RIF1 isoform X2 [Manduca sexta]|uniref:Telomere-associated protein RIF1 n=2 Tax=Manduca sexta TaxID=7130 RepID=A0A922CE13_MANSE|nr:telomere-associated protein RIF1 isoform X2 [Manduca sexta]XP_030039076.1 telomere-associated protein RIF1 isoform X2 [Manduca sexta]XP_030039082.1 telomere-associated protein RIF1 isoform X2 [Manduca sexta]KAG6442762.1 hypothetical protein O3G_MSEX002484 [Manduca sexta]KAG6442763.1 hypothetical protein O3G_MSEX002484 [Manduca sexta]KAG6442764.1 hypothetical protein O3G_MSEX002484 [Manduca sexta]KAG6442765.1 hypothetical protein O3G_MSEX002484 [Manduca sexta]KAG6442766.1 hypothetical prot